MDPHRPRNFRPEDAVSWPTLGAGSQVSYKPSKKSSGPWTVYFVVQGKEVKWVTTESSDDRVTLVRSGRGFQVQVN